MKTEWKILGNLTEQNNRVIIAKIRIEHEILISQDTISTVERAINRIGEMNILEMVSDNQLFIKELKEIVNIYYNLRECPKDTIHLINTEWTDFEGQLTLEALIELKKSLESINSFRIEGSPKTSMFMVFNIGSEIFRKPASESNLIATKQRIEALLTNQELSANASAWAGIVLGAIGVGIEAWCLFREEQDRARDEQEREQKKLERIDRERECNKDSLDSRGGPADHESMERVGRTC